MKLYDAISEMRRVSRAGGDFSFSFMSYNSSRGTSEGVIYVRSARLLQREDRKFNSHAEEMERYINLETMEARRFWHPLLMTYNNEVIEI